MSYRKSFSGLTLVEMRTVTVIRLALCPTRWVFLSRLCSEGLMADLRHYVRFSKVLKFMFGNAMWPTLRALESPSVNRQSREEENVSFSSMPRTLFSKAHHLRQEGSSPLVNTVSATSPNRAQPFQPLPSISH